MDWHSDICFICLDDFSSSKPRLFFHNCIHAVCVDCLHIKLDYYDSKQIKVVDLRCDYGRCNEPILDVTIGRIMNVHILNSNDSVYVYNFSTNDIPTKARVMIKDKLQEIMIKSQGLKLPELSEKTKNQIIQFEKQNYKLIMSDIIGKRI